MSDAVQINRVTHGSVHFVSLNAAIYRVREAYPRKIIQLSRNGIVADDVILAIELQNRLLIVENA